MKTKSTLIGIRVNKDLYERLHSSSSETGKSVSELTRDAIEYYFQTHTIDFVTYRKKELVPCQRN